MKQWKEGITEIPYSMKYVIKDVRLSPISESVTYTVTLLLAADRDPVLQSFADSEGFAVIMASFGENKRNSEGKIVICGGIDGILYRFCECV